MLFTQINHKVTGKIKHKYVMVYFWTKYLLFYIYSIPIFAAPNIRYPVLFLIVEYGF